MQPEENKMQSIEKLASVIVGIVGVTILVIGTALAQEAPQISSLSPGYGNAGTVVSISGRNFGAVQGASTVSFNGVPSKPNQWSATLVSVPVPQGATSGDIVITVNGQVSNGAHFSVGRAESNAYSANGVPGTPH
jgi:hypothetical protein